MKQTVNPTPKVALDSRLGATPGTYALVLALCAPMELQIGRLARLRFEAPFYIYFGSAFGPGGLDARVRHHLRPVRRCHWHIDYLRQAAEIVDVWYTSDKTPLECTWAHVALAQHDFLPVPRFGASDCRCQSHLLAADRRPSLRVFQRRLNDMRGTAGGPDACRYPVGLPLAGTPY